MSYDMLFQQALRLHETGQLKEAEQVYRQILETAPNHLEVLNLLGLTAQAQGVQSEAVNLFYQALKQLPQRADIYYNLAFSLKLWNKPIEALDNFGKALQLKHDIKEAHNEMGLLYEKIGNLSKAREAFEKALKQDKDFVEAKVNLILSYEQERQSWVISELENLTKLYPQEALVNYHLSNLYFKTKQLDKAWSVACQAKELAPMSDEVRVILGQLSMAEGKFDNAQIYFEKAHLLNPYNLAAIHGLADLATNKRDFAKAETYYKRMLELEPRSFEAHANYANMLYLDKRSAEALEEYRQAIIINPKSAEVSNNLAMILKDVGDYEQALGLLFNAFNLNPEMAEVAVNIAETLTLAYRSGKKNEAIKIAENWLKSAPNNVFAQRINAAFKGEKVENNSEYTESLFDNFADGYELVLQTVGYTVPLAMARIIGDVQATIVDLGCGTGLLGQALKNAENELIGVDLSQRMLDIAKEKGVYQELVKMDALQYLQTHSDFEMVVAADVMGYIGDLAPLIKACNGKAMAFSIEIGQSDDFSLQEAGRYQHNPWMVEKLLQDNGYQHIVKETLDLRVENGKPVAGMIFLAK